MKSNQFKSLLDCNKKAANSKIWKMEKKVEKFLENVKKLEESIDMMNVNEQDVFCAVEANSNRLSAVEEKSYNLGISFRALKVSMSKQFQIIEQNLGIKNSHPTNIIQPSALPQHSKELDQVRSDIIPFQQSASDKKN